MSETGTAGQSEGAWMAPTGSRRWFWQMRLTHAPLFIAPFVMLPVPLSAWDAGGVKDPSTLTRLVHTVPWVLAAAIVFTLTHALWRIVVNMATSRPFTEKDRTILNRAMWVQVSLGLVIVVAGFVGVPAYMMIAGVKGDEVQYTSALYGPLAVSAVIGMLTHAIQLMYQRARTYYQELEKGV